MSLYAIYDGIAFGWLRITGDFIFQIIKGNTPFLMRRYAWSHRRRKVALRKTCSESAEGPRLRKNGNVPATVLFSPAG